jgi:hypothetical protein
MALRGLASGDETIQSPVYNEEVEITPENRAMYERRWQDAWRQRKQDRSGLEAQYDQHYGRRGAQPTPQPGPPVSPAGPLPQPGPAGAAAAPTQQPGPGGSLEAMKAQSWMEEATDPVQMPGAGEWGQLSPEDQMVFTELQRLEEEGFNVDAPSVQEYVMRLVQERMARQRSQRMNAGREIHSRWPQARR